ncbi:MAG: L,D-transpeptidase [Solirubrobacterales bacterium]|nr:L,D-transpeptidase [Solirubrobacterales bacterium]
MGQDQHAGARARPGRWILIALGVAIPAIPVAIGIVLGLGQPGAGAASANTTTSAFTPVPSHSSAPAHHNSPPGLLVPPGPGAIVALLVHPTALFAAPRSGRVLAQLPTRTQFGSPETALVVSQSGGWLGVVVPQAGNGHIGWITVNAVTLARIHWELKVSLAARRLTVLEAGKVVERYPVAIGEPSAPTPTGRFAVTDRLSTGDPSGPYGCCILALSAHSPHAIQGWDGGNRIAIHSTPEVSSIGEAASHGCVRVTLPDGRWLLAHIPLGTPTLISS